MKLTKRQIPILFKTRSLMKGTRYSHVFLYTSKYRFSVFNYGSKVELGIEDKKKGTPLGYRKNKTKQEFIKRLENQEIESITISWNKGRYFTKGQHKEFNQHFEIRGQGKGVKEVFKALGILKNSKILNPSIRTSNPLRTKKKQYDVWII